MTYRRHTRHSSYKARLLRLAWLLLVGMPFVAPAPAFAQVIIMSVDGDPVTDLDVAQRIKLLRVLHKPASEADAKQSLIDDRLKLHDAAKYSVSPTDTDVGQQVYRAATEMKTNGPALINAMHQAGITDDQIKAHFGAEFVFDLLIQALNKSVEASETQVREELAKEGGKIASNTDYVLRQVILTLTNKATPANVSSRIHEAEQLRGRFTNCDEGVRMISSLPDAAIREPITRSSGQLNDQLRQLLEKTPVGHLTPPSRTTAGLEMIALCSRTASKDDSIVRKEISTRLLAAHLQSEANRRLADLRSHAVIVKR